ncbi:SusD/RagB family nutrient-binding outer membrane lipoprotein [Flavobacterium branchiarum]|uniref:SusD/RagB family nutrient-binding outer membrane lipoprotein n=1 Tax=Flavobacterium branchiarum TaxID=1114870 RepID=A0ABV5FP02_9FLAO|nr:SusD/RagB family nutrient-binding outer membrane lipoprotein [Flavobacterium branchiarum]MDN3671857.1 SusD/RagB family nutrient-binding outer membrane lipoprotein [Flavobacterium branchiarum]
MKKIFISLLSVMALGLLTTTVSCSDGLEELNQDPNRPEIINVPAYGLFNYTNKFIMDNTRSSFPSGRLALPWVQYSAQVAYTEEDRFKFRIETKDDFYRDLNLAAKDYKTIIDINTNPVTAAKNSVYGNTNNQIAAARVMLAYTFSILVDTYGDVPYYSYGNNDPDFQALQLDKGISEPKFASQAKIYTDILKELKESVAMLVLNEKVFTKGDVLFGGDANKLKKFANSLRLRIATRVNGVIPGAATHITEAIDSGVMTSNSDNVGVKYENNNVFPSPFFTGFFTDARSDFKITNTLVDLLKGKIGVFGIVDPRLQKYASPNTAGLVAIRDKTYTETDDLTKYIGMPYGIPNSSVEAQTPNTSYWSSDVLRRDYTEILMEYAEVEFLLSENNGWSDTNYKNGIKASMERWGVASAKINTYLAAVAPANKENVITQKYLALFMQPGEAWAEYRRTGFPSSLLKPGQSYPLNVPEGSVTTYTFEALNNLTEMPTRLTYPTNAANLNGANYDEAVKNMGGDKLDTKLIWDKN